MYTAYGHKPQQTVQFVDRAHSRGWVTHSQHGDHQSLEVSRGIASYIPFQIIPMCCE
jgi:hypothetical protein